MGAIGYWLTPAPGIWQNMHIEALAAKWLAPSRAKAARVSKGALDVVVVEVVVVVVVVEVVVVVVEVVE